MTNKNLHSIFAFVWFGIFPILFAFFALYVAMWEFDAINFDMTHSQATVFLNASALLAVIYLAGFVLCIVTSVIYHMIKKKGNANDERTKETID